MKNQHISKALNAFGSAALHDDPPEVVAEHVGRFVTLLLGFCSAADGAEDQSWSHRWADSDLGKAVDFLRPRLPRSFDAILFENGVDGVRYLLARAADSAEARKRARSCPDEAHGFVDAAALAQTLMNWASFVAKDAETCAPPPTEPIVAPGDATTSSLARALAIPVDGLTVSDTMASAATATDRDPFVTAYILHDLAFPPSKGALDLAEFHLAHAANDPDVIAHVALAVRSLLTAGARGEQMTPEFDPDRLSALCADALIPLLEAVGPSMAASKVIIGLRDLEALVERLRWRQTLESADILVDRLDRLALFADDLDALHRRRRITARGAPLARASAIRTAQSEPLPAAPLN